MTFRDADPEKTLQALREENAELRRDLDRARSRIPAAHWAAFGVLLAGGCIVLAVLLRRPRLAVAADIAWVTLAVTAFYLRNRKGPPTGGKLTDQMFHPGPHDW